MESQFTRHLTISYTAADKDDLRIQLNIEEVIAFIDTHMPGYADLGETSLYQGASWLRMRFIHAFDEVYGREQADAFIGQTAQRRRVEGRSPGFEDQPKLYIQLLSLGGRTEEAIDVALNDILSKPRINMPDWRTSSRSHTSPTSSQIRALLKNSIAGPQKRPKLARIRWSIWPIGGRNE